MKSNHIKPSYVKAIKRAVNRTEVLMTERGQLRLLWRPENSSWGVVSKDGNLKVWVYNLEEAVSVFNKHPEYYNKE